VWGLASPLNFPPKTTKKETFHLLQTTNYQLCQWEPSDRILRTDFNRDNEKIDTALAAAAGQSVLRPIREIITTESATSIQIQLDDIDWSQWQSIVVDAYLTSNNKGPVRIDFNVSNEIGSAYSSVTPTEEGSQPGCSRLVLFCNGGGSNWVNALSLNYQTAEFLNKSHTFSYITYLKYGGSVTTLTFPAGTRFRIWGVK